MHQVELQRRVSFVGISTCNFFLCVNEKEYKLKTVWRAYPVDDLERTLTKLAGEKWQES